MTILGIVRKTNSIRADRVSACDGSSAVRVGIEILGGIKRDKADPFGREAFLRTLEPVNDRHDSGDLAIAPPDVRDRLHDGIAGRRDVLDDEDSSG